MWDAGEGTGAAGGGGRADGAAGPGGQGAAGDGRETQTAAVSHTSSFLVSFNLLSFAHIHCGVLLMDSSYTTQIFLQNQNSMR